MSTPPQNRTWEEAVLWLRDQPDYAYVVRESYYDDPLAAAADRYWRSAEWQSLKPYLGEGRGRALDVGAGRGIASYALAREGFQVTALEPDPSAVVGAQAIRDLARDAALPIEVREDFSERLPFADASFDLVFVRAVLHHTSDLPLACREFFRVLKPGGRLVAIREHVISRPSDLPAFLAQHPLHNLYGGENALLLSQYTAAIQGAGFAPLEVIAPLQSPINYFPQTLETIRGELVQRVGRLPGGAAVMRLATATRAGLRLALRMAALFDNRPGRHYSFIGVKPRGR